ncbi:MAG: hypothetical protein Q7U47_09740 [Paludibacter sp.]|nr:hypothetical protein [Paludibacter sp.]
MFACSDSNGPVIGTANWLFTVKTTTSTSPAVSGYPQTTTTTVTKNGLTTKEAEDVVTGLTSTATSSQYISGYGTLTVTVIKSECKVDFLKVFLEIKKPRSFLNRAWSH